MSTDLLPRISAGRTDLVIDHLAAGHPANSTDSDGVPLIRLCAYYGDVSAVRYLLDHGEDSRIARREPRSQTEPPFTAIGASASS